MGLTKKEGIPVQPADAERVRARSVKTHINWRPLVALMTASNAVMTEWGAEQESEGRDDDNERLNQPTDRQLVSWRKEGSKRGHFAKDHLAVARFTMHQRHKPTHKSDIAIRWYEWMTKMCRRLRPS